MQHPDARRALSTVGAVGSLLLAVSALGVLLWVDVQVVDLGRADLRPLRGPGPAFVAAVFSATITGAVLLRRRPDHPVGWWFVVLGASVAVAGSAEGYGQLAIAAPAGRYPGGPAAALVASSAFVLWLVTIAMVCFLTPTGRHLTPRWRRLARAMLVCGAVWLVAIVLSPGPLQAPFEQVDNPWGVDAVSGVLGPVRLVSGLVNNVLVLVSFASLVVRYRRSVGEERRQLLWLGLVVVPVPVLLAVTFIAARTGDDALVNIGAAGFVACFPIAVGLAVARVRLYDVDRILSRAATYAVLSLVLAATYGTVVLLVAQGLGSAAGSSTVAVALATLAVAVLARPAHQTVQEVIDRRFSRRRYDALRVVREHVANPVPGASPEQVLRTALGAADLSVSYWVPGRESWVTSDGGPAAPSAGAATVTRRGRLVARVDAPGTDPVLLSAVLREAEPELDNTGLRAAVALQLVDVRASRERLADAQLEERRRVERDLHDGAQQRLLALAAQLQAALLNGGADRMREALATGVEQSQVAVRELRELANGLHPSVLVDGGLAPALDELARRHRVDVEVDDGGRRYPPGVEATAWFVACEAVSNAVKHAAADRILVRVEGGGGGLRLTVEDDGLGGADPAGSGLRGLADRAEAVGGALRVTPRQPHGTSVEVVLPCGS